MPASETIPEDVREAAQRTQEPMQSERITPSTAWAPVSPVGKRGTRWILYQFASATMRECRMKMGADWAYWRKRGWTIERVRIGRLRQRPTRGRRWRLVLTLTTGRSEALESLK